MSISDCEKCWATPCKCGWDYRNWKIEWLKQQIDMLGKVLIWKENHPNAKFSDFTPETEDDNDFMVGMGIKKMEKKIFQR